MDRVKKARAPIRSRVTRLCNEVEAQIDTGVPHKQTLEVLLEKLEGVQERLKEWDNHMMNAMLDVDADDDDIAIEDDEAEAYQDKIREAFRLVREVIQPKPEEQPTSSYSTGGNNNEKRTFKLPKVELRQFNGELKEWLGWWAQFKKIDEDKTLHATDKFQYLVQCIPEGTKAWPLVCSYPMSEENYPKVVAALQERFGKTELLQEVYVRELLKIVTTNAANPEEGRVLSNMYDKLESHLRALASLGISGSNMSVFLKPMIESSLPAHILVAWQRSPNYVKDGSTENPPKSKYDYLMEFIRGEVENEVRRSLVSSLDELKIEDQTTGQAHKGAKKNGTKSTALIPTATGLIAVSGSSGINSCIFCGMTNHQSPECRKASTMTLDDKEKIIKEKKACFKCFRTGHSAAKCRSRISCLICGKNHQTLLCRNTNFNNSGVQPKDTGVPVEVPKPQVPMHHNAPETSQAATGISSNYANQCQSPEVLLQTLVVKIHGIKGAKLVRALIDTGSQKSYVLKSIAEEIGLNKVGTDNVIHALFGGTETQPVEHSLYKIYLSEMNGKFTCDFVVSDVQKISGKIQCVPNGPWMNELKEKQIWISDFGREKSEIEVLIGADIAGRLMTGKLHELRTGPVAVETRLGWTLMGKLPVNLNKNVNSTMMVFNLHVRDVEISKLWELDVIGIEDPGEKKTRDEIEKSALDHFESTVKKNEDGRFEVHLPWVEGHAPLPTNQGVAERRLKSTTESLKREGNLQKYDELFKAWEAAGMIEEVPENDLSLYGHYLPHRAVYKESSTTTPIRPVFDASSKTKGQCSLNDCLEKGPNLVELIPAVMTRFRMKAVGIVADIEKAFQQISVTKKDRDFLRFLWWKDLECDKVKVYRHCRVVFGVSSSPFILGAALQHLLKNAPQHLQNTAAILMKTLYVDNVAASVDEESAVKFKDESTDLLSTGRFKLRGWEIGPSQEEKVVPLLGLNWAVKADELYCDLSQAMKKIDGPVSKRKILSLAHTVFDPIGFTTPFTLIPKFLLQEAWNLKLGWDSALPEDVVKKFDAWRKQITELNQLRIPRWIAKASDDHSNWSLHTFVDASNKAYAACVFLRIEGSQRATVQLLQSKSRVAPLKKLSIPRLELLSCVIGARLVRSVVETLNLPNIKSNLWSDSSSSLYWIKNDGNWGIFVQRRVEEVRRLTGVNNWRHIPGELNPADFPSRGGTVKQIIASKFWEGPIWLKKSEEQWPRSTVTFNEEEINAEKKKSVVSALSHNQSVLWKEICACLTFDEMVEIIFQQQHPDKEEMNMDDRIEAEKELLKLVQEATFTGVKDEKLNKLNVMKDKDGMIRLKTRLSDGQFEDGFKYPIVLPSKSPVVAALILKEHENNCHTGNQTLLSLLRENYWILKSRRTIRSAIRKCENCQVFNAKKMECESAPLPKERMTADIPFQVTGVDMFGPLFLKSGSKCWVALFTCAVYRAVHLELVSSLSTDAFKNAFRRFVARRGRPDVVYSDNGTNFVGANNQFKAINWKKVEKFGAFQKIRWRFNPPTAAWWGGFWERMVGVVKQTMRKILGRASLEFEDLQTVLCDVERIVNRRPLTYVSEDPEDLAPLSPYLFLTGNKSSDVPEADIVDGKGLNKRLKYIQRVREDLRSRFRKEYLGQLRTSRMSSKNSPELKIGEKVMIGHDNQKRLNWPIGKIEELIQGRDGRVRVVKVKTEDGLLLRPIQRIYPLETYEEEPVEVLSPEQEPTEEKEDEVKVVTRYGRNVKLPNRLTYLYIDN